MSNPRILYKELLYKGMTSDKNIFRNKQILLLHILTEFGQSNFWSWKLLWTLRKNHSEEKIGWYHVIHLHSIEVLGSFGDGMWSFGMDPNLSPSQNF